MAALVEKYKGRAEFVFVYCRESHPAEVGRWPHPHPEWEPPSQPENMTQRMEIAKQFALCANPRRPLIVDEFDDRSLHGVYGAIDNPTVVVDVDGKVAFKLAWTDAGLLDVFLEKFLRGDGRVDSALAACAPFHEESLFVRMSVARRLWKEDHEVRGAVPLFVEALRGAPVAEAASPLANAMPAHVRREIIRQTRIKAAEALGEMGPAAKASVSALRDAVREGDSTLSAAASEALRRVDPKTFHTTLGIPDARPATPSLPRSSSPSSAGK